MTKEEFNALKPGATIVTCLRKKPYVVCGAQHRYGWPIREPGKEFRGEYADKPSQWDLPAEVAAS